MTKQLRFKIPGPDEPGFLRRMRQALELQEQLQSNPNPATMEKMVEFLSVYVDGPQDKAVEMLWDASQEQIEQLVAAITGQEDSGPFDGKTGG